MGTSFAPEVGFVVECKHDFVPYCGRMNADLKAQGGVASAQIYESRDSGE